MLYELLNAFEETLFMMFSAGLLTWIVGLPLGTLLAVTSTGKILENPALYRTLRFGIQTVRSLPYLILMIALIPLTRFLMGSHKGCIAAVIPLSLAAIPYFAALCEKAIHRIPGGIIDVARIAGATPFQIIYKVLIPEALPQLIKALTLTLVHLIGYSTIAGALGAGGLGGLMVEKGYHDFNTGIVIATVLVLLLLIQAVQWCGRYIAGERV